MRPAASGWAAGQVAPANGGPAWERGEGLLGSLPAPFLRFAVGTSLCTAGLVTFGLLGFHLVQARLVPTAGVPLLYAGAMAAGAVAALLTGEGYDRLGPRVLLLLPPLVAVVLPLALNGGLAAVVVGVLVWGAATGVQDSAVKALVADLVPKARRDRVRRLRRRAGRGRAGGRGRDRRAVRVVVAGPCRDGRGDAGGGGGGGGGAARAGRPRPAAPRTDARRRAALRVPSGQPGGRRVPDSSRVPSASELVSAAEHRVGSRTARSSSSQAVVNSTLASTSVGQCMPR